tara:strand:+ start:56324 stop:57769 length:1446 start_codon:yes stop_codon:yes gene_type:complete
MYNTRLTSHGLASAIHTLSIAALLAACTVDPDAGADENKSDAGATIDWTSTEFEGRLLERARIPVPLSYDSATSYQVDLDVTRLLNPDPEAKSLLFLQGGPGGDAGALLGYFFPGSELTPLLETHSLYFVNSRGLGENATGFCEDFFAMDLPTDVTDESRIALQSCFDSDRNFLEAISTPTTARDLDTIRRTLDLPSWSVFGVSYGTSVASTYASLYAETVDSLILDSVTDPDIDLVNELAPAVLDSALLLQERCANEATCPIEFAENGLSIIESLFVRSQEGWVEDDFLLGEVEVTPNAFTALLSGTLSDTSARSSLPSMLVEAYEGEPSSLLGALPPEQTLTPGNLINVVILCREFITGASSTTTFFGDVFLSTYSQYCPTVLDNFEVIESQSSGASMPTLVLSGQADPLTPPAFGDKVAEKFSNSQHAVLSGYGHGVVDSPCGAKLALEFLDNQSTALDDTCSSDQPEWADLDDDFDF